MRRTTLFFCVSAVSALCGAAQAGDRYGAPGNSPAAARAPDWNGPLLNWSNKPEAVTATAAVAPAPAAATADPAPLADWAKRAAAAPIRAPQPASLQPSPAVRSASLPTSLYDAAPAAAPQTAAPIKSAPDAYHPVRPTGEVVTLSLANLPPPGPSLERQQAADDDAQVLAAQIARANAQAAQSRASGKAVSTATTDLLGGPQ